MGAPFDLPSREEDAGTAEEARTRRALLHMLEDLQRERDDIRRARRSWVETVDAVDSPLVVVDGDSRILRANKAYAGRAGMGYQELTGRPYWECFPKRSGPIEATLPPMQTGAKHAPETEFLLDTGEIFLARSYPVGEGKEAHVLHLFEDVTEKRRANDALHQREKDLARAQRVASMGSWTWDVASDVVTWSDEVYRIYGRDSGLPAPTLAEQAQMYTPESWARLQAVVAAMHSNGLPDEIDVEIVRPDGSTGWISLRCELERGAGGRIVRLLGTALDVTERRRSDEAIRASEQRFRALFTNMLEGLAQCEMIFEDGRPVDCRYLAVNPAFEVLTGLKDVVGKTLGEVIPGALASQPAVLEAYARVSLGGKPERMESYVKALDIWFSIFVYNAGKNRFTAVFDNITERKRQDAALRESEARYRAMFDQAAVGMLQTSLDGVLMNVNAAFAKMLGYSESELEGHHFAEFTHPEDKTKSLAQKSILAAADIGLQSTFEKRYIRKDGSALWARVAVAVVCNDEGEPQRFVTLVEDISEHKKAESDLRWRTAFFESLVQTSADGILVVDSKGRKVVQNQRMADLWKIPKAFAEDVDDSAQLQFVATQVAEPKQFVDRIAYLFAHREETSQDEIALKDGTILDRYSAPVKDREGNYYGRIWSFHDITERKRAETALRKANRALKTVSSGNSAVVHAVSEEALLQRMCEVVVEAGYRMAWVGFAVQDAARSVAPMACAGAGEEYLAEAGLSWADTERGRGPVGRSMRTGVPQAANAIASDPSMAPWREQALKHGYQSSVALPLAGGSGVFGVLNIYASEPGAFDAEEVKLLEDLAGDLAYGIASLRAGVERRATGEKLRRSLEGTIGAIGATMESRDPYTAGHQRRVAELAAAMALEMGLPAQVVEGVHFGALIHDLGKIQVPAEILSKPSRLSKLEFELIKSHAQTGYDIVKEIEFPWPIAEMVYQHHERLDGSGYPQGLKGDEITLEARILSVADVVEAMSSHRPYRPGLGLDAALEEIGEQRGKGLDADAVDACTRLFRDKRFAFKTP